MERLIEGTLASVGWDRGNPYCIIASQCIADVMVSRSSFGLWWLDVLVLSASTSLEFAAQAESETIAKTPYEAFKLPSEIGALACGFRVFSKSYQQRDKAGTCLNVPRHTVRVTSIIGAYG